ncbi:hypothetical protein [Pedobacter sp. MC2016-24]|uniref:hypothetical protein n=1 Tax=Pedobacter sp. MC2016-24 TaxID=2780090 RepID=UPI001881D81A|nr:hypothetical protein [Pedobacter sp. MC2016-24]MBE9597793.1 hypothetical protein [Pedobacter sp. MC2016-24]
MGTIAEQWEPFEIEVMIEGKMKKLLVIPDREEPKYAIFDEHTLLGTIWQDTSDQGKFWCGEGLVVKEILPGLGEQVSEYLANRPI